MVVTEKKIEFPKLRWLVQRSGYMLILLPLAGCNRNDVSLAGSVQFSGDPVADGLIELIPVGATTGGSCGTRIIGGKYLVPSGVGLKPGGDYKVVLRGFRKQMQPDPTNPGHLVEAAENYLPSEWGEQSTHQIHVAADASAVRQDFDVRPSPGTGSDR